MIIMRKLFRVLRTNNLESLEKVNFTDVLCSDESLQKYYINCNFKSTDKIKLTSSKNLGKYRTADLESALKPTL